MADLNDFPGVVIVWPNENTFPPGWLLCSGQAVSRATYADLFAAIGTAWGAGDGSTTFNVPDLRGEFPRGVDDGRGVDPGRAFASNQDGQEADHQHTTCDVLDCGSLASYSSTSWPYGAAPDEPAIATTGTGGANACNQVPRRSGPPNTVTPVADPRPPNIALNFLIRT